MRHIRLVILMTAAILLLAACGAASQAERPAVSSQAATAPATTERAAVPVVSTEVATAPSPAATAVTATGPAGATPAAAAPPTTATSEPTPTTAPVEATAESSAASPGPATAETIVLSLQPDSEASYRVREQLANVSLPNDAVGTTNAVTGAISLRSDGTVLADQSKFVVDLSTLRSDSGMRDNYIKRNTLQTNTYPEATFVPTAVEGLPSPLPASGDVSFKMTGDLTVRDVTKPVTWDVQAKVAGNELTGTAATAFKFGDFGMTPPTTMRVLSIEDNIILEIKFRLSAANT
jgi:polyisoprenoid-binding protein YceI